MFLHFLFVEYTLNDLRGRLKRLAIVGDNLDWYLPSGSETFETLDEGESIQVGNQIKINCSSDTAIV